MPLTRRGLILLLALACGGHMACEDDPAPPEQASRRVVIVDSDDAEPYETTRRSMLAALAQAGYVDGGSITIERHDIDNDEERARATLRFVASDPPAVVVLNGTVPAPAGTELQIAVRLYWSGHDLSSSYRLIVVGSGTALGATNISGDHVGRWR